MLQIRLKRDPSSEAVVGGRPLPTDRVTVACPDHLVLANLPVAKVLGAAASNSVVKVVGRKSRRQLGERVHFCVKCDFPIAIYGRLSPCEHVFCLDCARSDSICYICDERIQKIQTIKMMEGIFICAAPHCLKSFTKKSEFEDHIHESHYDLLNPNAEKEEGNESEARNLKQHTATESTARGPPRQAFSPGPFQLHDHGDKAHNLQSLEQPPTRSPLQRKKALYYGQMNNPSQSQGDNRHPPSHHSLRQEQGQFHEKPQGISSNVPFHEYPPLNPTTFAEDIRHTDTNEEVYGVLSLVFWTLTLVPLLKYVFIVLRADDNGEGGTFALYSLLCRHARVNSLPNCQVADEELSEYKREGVSLSPKTRFGACLKSSLERHKLLQRLLLILALIGTCMVIGDGVLTPAISVFSAVSGLELSMAKQHHKYVEVPVACIILIGLFALQHYGTHRVGFLFAPVVMTWLLCISSIGLYNIIHWNPHVYRALSPYHMLKFLKKTQREGWMSLGGILLCITGSEAMFADLGHFSQLSIKIAFTFMVYPSLVLAYMGQAAYLSMHHEMENDYRVGFYVSVPEKLRWPVLAVAILAAVVGSQAIITGTFSVIKQCSALDCFPRVKIVHTSSRFHGQIYIPEINWILMVLCLAVTIGFRDMKRMGNAAGLAVITVMLVTTCLMPLVIVLCWHRNVLLAVAFVLFFGTIEALYFSASLIKFLEGAWVPIALSFIFLLVMYIWHFGTLKKHEFDIQNKVSINWLLGLSPSLGVVRVRGIGLIHTDLVTGIPAIFSHLVTNLPAFHKVLVFLCVKSVPVPHVGPEERFLIGRIGPRECRIYRCIVRYGYRDFPKDDVEFERDLVCSIAEFIRSENMEPGGSRTISTGKNEYGDMKVVGTRSTGAGAICVSEGNMLGRDTAQLAAAPQQQMRRVRFVIPESSRMAGDSVEELRELMEAQESGTAYILGHYYVRAKHGSGLIKRLAIDVVYNFLRQNSRSPAYASSVPHASTIEVGMICRL